MPTHVARHPPLVVLLYASSLLPRASDFQAKRSSLLPRASDFQVLLARLVLSRERLPSLARDSLARDSPARDSLAFRRNSALASSSACWKAELSGVPMGPCLLALPLMALSLSGNSPRVGRCHSHPRILLVLIPSLAKCPAGLCTRGRPLPVGFPRDDLIPPRMGSRVGYSRTRVTRELGWALRWRTGTTPGE